MLSILKKIISNSISIVFRYNVYNIYIKEITFYSQVNLPIGYEFKTVSSEFEYSLLTANGYDFSEYPKSENIENGLSSHGILICIFFKKKIAHTTWIARSYQSAIYDSVFSKGVFNNKDFGFIGPCKTYAEHRGKGLYPSALSFAFNMFLQYGLKFAMINTRNNNYSSIKGIMKCHFRHFSTLFTVYIFGMKKYFTKATNLKSLK